MVADTETKFAAYPVAFKTGLITYMVEQNCNLYANKEDSERLVS